MWGYPEQFDQEEDEEEMKNWDEYEEKHSVNKNCAIAVIDASASMFDKEPDSECPFEMCLRACYLMMEKMLFKRYHNNFAVCIMTETENTILVDFSDSLVTAMKKILEVLHDTYIYKLKLKYERVLAKDFFMMHYLRDYIKMASKLKKANPYVVIMTTDDQPHKCEEADKRNLGTYSVAKSFSDINMQLLVLPLVENFNYDPFYKSLIECANNIKLTNIPGEVYETKEEIVDVLELVAQSRRNIRRMVFRFSDSFFLHVQVKKFYHVQKIYHNVYVQRDTKAVVKRRWNPKDNIDPDRKHIVLDNYRPMVLSKVELKKYFKCDVWVGFQLLYVSEKRSKVHYLKYKPFLVQLDELVTEEGQQVLFDYIWEYCFYKNRVMICSFLKPGSRSIPRKCELSPDRHKGKPCFNAVVLPHFNEVRQLPLPNNDRYVSKPILSTEIDAAKAMIETLSMQYFEPDWLSSIEYELKAGQIKSHLLDITMPPISEGFPQLNAVDETLGTTAQYFSQLVLRDNAKPSTSQKGRKRKLT